MSGTHWLWLEKCHLFLNLRSSVVQSIQWLFFPDLWDVRPQIFLPMLGLACGTENQGAGVGLGLLVLVNVISVVTHKVFVFHHAAVSAHPLCQPASLSPGIIYPRSTEHMGHTLSCLSVAPLPASANQVAPVVWAVWCNVPPPPIGLNGIFRPTGCPGCMPFDMAGLPWERV